MHMTRARTVEKYPVNYMDILTVWIDTITKGEHTQKLYPVENIHHC